MSLILSSPQVDLSLAAGGLTTLSPCVFPLLPPVLGGAIQGNQFAPLAMGVAILTGGDKWLEGHVLQWLPDAWVNFAAGI